MCELKGMTESKIPITKNESAIVFAAPIMFAAPAFCISAATLRLAAAACLRAGQTWVPFTTRQDCGTHCPGGTAHAARVRARPQRPVGCPSTLAREVWARCFGRHRLGDPSPGLASCGDGDSGWPAGWTLSPGTNLPAT
jgi:hypothetical protein